MNGYICEPISMFKLKNLKKRKIGQHPELPGAVPHPSAGFDRVKSVPGA